MSDKIQTEKLYSNGYLLWDKEIHDKGQHCYQQDGLDKYVNMWNRNTHQWNFVKLYENTKGLHVKVLVDGKSTHYLEEFTQEATLVPLQVFEGFIDG